MDFPGKKIMPRYFIIAALLCLVGAAVVVKVVYIMTVKKDYWMAVNNRFQRSNVSVPPTRGDILADDGEVLAASIPEYKMFMDFMSWEKDSVRRAKDQYRRDTIIFATVQEKLTAKDSLRMGKEAFLKRKKCPPLVWPLKPNARLDTICRGMHSIFPDIDPDALRKHILEGRNAQSHHWPLYNRRVTYIQYRAVKMLPLFRLSSNRGGFHTEKIETRKNPYGRLAVRTVGDLYKGKDSARSGLELGLDSILRGKPGVSHRQKVLNSYLTIIDRPAENGCDVQTTLNVTMQDICEKALGDQLRKLQDDGTGDVNFGVCIVMEVATGDVKAITSLSRLADGSFLEIQNKAISNLMEPGSVFKPMSFLVAFNDGFIHMDDRVNVGNGIMPMHGRKMKDHNWRTGGYGTLTVRQCIQKSSNVGVSTFIDRYYGKNPQKFVDGILATGVADDMQIPIPGYAVPKIKSPKSSYWAKTDLPWMSIGYVTQIPPISTLAFYNGIANNGRMMRPRFVKAILKNGEVVRNFDPVVVREHMANEEAVRNIQTCLREVVTLGVGKKAGSRQVHVAGKTGTAQVWSAAGRTAGYLVSFAGYFPYENPKYSCIVCINKTGFASGGTQCGPVFKRVAETVMAQQLQDNYKKACDSVNVRVPVVAGGNVAAAARALTRLGLKYTDHAGTESVPVAWGTTQTTDSEIVLNAVEQNRTEVPNVKGYGLRDALFCLEKLGLKVKVAGAGRVTAQSLQPGYVFKKGEEITLTLGKFEENREWADTLKQQRGKVEIADEEAVGGEAVVADKTKKNVKKTVESRKNEGNFPKTPTEVKKKSEATDPKREKPRKKDEKERKKAISSKNREKTEKQRKV